jgi:hypothetical protein
LGEPGESAVDIIGDCGVMPADLVNELKQDSRPEAMDRLGVPLPTQTGKDGG